MDDEFEVTRSSGEDSEAVRRQMLETRSALSEKIEKLEQQVYDTVQGAAETVENVKQSVQDTVQSVTSRVKDTVQSVSDSVDLRHHVEQQPWTMLCSAVTLGCVAGYLTAPNDEQRARSRMRWANWDPTGRGERFAESDEVSWPSAADWSSGPAFASSQGSQDYGNGHHRQSSGVQSGSGVQSPSQPSTSSMQAMRQSSSCATTSWLHSLSEAFAPSIEKLKGLAIGASLGVARDIAMQSAPGGITNELRDIFDNLTTSLGGKPMKGRVMENHGGGDGHSSSGHSQANKSGEWHEQ